MKRVKAYLIKSKNTSYVNGIGHVAGKPAGDLKKGDTFLRVNGDHFRVSEKKEPSPKTVAIFSADGFRFTYRKTTIVPMMWDDSDNGTEDAAKYGHRV